MLFVAGASPVGAGELRWVQAEFKARKLFMTIDLDMELELLPAAEVLGALPPAFKGEALELSGEEAAIVTLRSRRPAQKKESRLYLDPKTGAALRRFQREWSDKPDTKDLRYTLTGIARTRSEPVKGEADMSPDQWSQVRQQFRPFPDTDETAVVSDTAALPFLIATQAWQGPGQSFEVLVFEDQKFVRVTATAQRWNDTRVDYRTKQGAVGGKKRLLEVRVIAAAMDNTGQPDIDLFGLSSDVLLLLDTELAVPVEIRGSVAFLGEVRFALVQVR